MPGTAPVVAQLQPLSNGVATAVTLPALAPGSGTGTVPVTASVAPPAGVPSVSSARRERAVGSANVLEYLALTPQLSSSLPLIFVNAPTLVFTVTTPFNVLGYGLAQYGSANGWNAAQAGLTMNVAAGTLTFTPTTTGTFTLAAPIYFALYILAPVPSPTPSPSPSPSPTPSPSPSASPKSSPTASPGPTSTSFAVTTGATVALTGLTGGTISPSAFSTTAPSGFPIPPNATFYGTAGASNTGTTAATATKVTFTATLMPAPQTGSLCYLATQATGQTAAYSLLGTLATQNGSTTFTSMANNVTFPAGASYTYVVYCAPPPARPTPSPTPAPTATPTPKPVPPTATPKPPPSPAPTSSASGAFNVAYPIWSVAAGSGVGNDAISISGQSSAPFSFGSTYSPSNTTANCIQGAAVTPNPAASGVTVAAPAAGTIIATAAIVNNATPNAAVAITPVTSGAGASGGSCTLTVATGFLTATPSTQTIQVLVTSASVTGS